MSNDLISRSALIRVVEMYRPTQVYNNNTDTQNKMVAFFLDEIESAPPASDIVKGEWLVKENEILEGFDLYCSRCGKVHAQLMSRSLSAEEAKEHLKENCTKFCSECGADMRGDKQ